MAICAANWGFRDFVKNPWPPTVQESRRMIDGVLSSMENIEPSKENLVGPIVLEAFSETD